MILTHGANSISRGGGGDFVDIGGKKHPYALMPDGKYWLTVNLDYAWEGLAIGGTSNPGSNPHAWYQQNNEALNGWNGRKFGLLYNGYALDYLIANISTMIPGWHVADSANDWRPLFMAIGNNSHKNQMMKDNLDYASSTWNQYATNTSGFSVLPGGACRISFDEFEFQDGNPSSFGRGYIWSASFVNSKYPRIIWSQGTGNEPGAYDNQSSKNYGASIRLVKDAT